MKKIVISGIGILVIAGTGLALRPTSSTGAEVKSPLVTQVENHEERIGDLEEKTDNTQTQTDQNTADIEAVRQQTGTTAAPKVSTVKTPVAQPSQPTQGIADPTPTEQVVESQPEPEVHPRTITAVRDSGPGANEWNGHTCNYTLHDPEENAKQGAVIQPNSIPCYEVGDILPRT